MHLRQTHNRHKCTLLYTIYYYHTCTVQIQCNDNNNRLLKYKNPGRRGFPRAAAKYENVTTSFYPAGCSFLYYRDKKKISKIGIAIAIPSDIFAAHT